MRKILFLLLCINIFSIYAQEEKNVITNSFVSFTLDALEEELGENFKEYTYKVKRKHKFVSEAEPDYSRYFSQSELKKGVKIRCRVWKQEKRTKVVWASKKDEHWIVFRSIDYLNGTVF